MTDEPSREDLLTLLRTWLVAVSLRHGHLAYSPHVAAVEYFIGTLEGGGLVHARANVQHGRPIVRVWTTERNAIYIRNLTGLAIPPEGTR